MLRRNGFHYKPETQRKTHWRTHHYGWLDKTIAGCSGSLKVNLSLLVRQLKSLDDILAGYGEEVEALAATPRYQEPVKALTCYKGIKNLFALTMITEIGDVRRFAHPRQLVSWAGMDIREYASAVSRTALALPARAIAICARRSCRSESTWLSLRPGSAKTLKPGERTAQARRHCHCRSLFTPVEQEGKSFAARGQTPEQGEGGLRSRDGGLCLGITEPGGGGLETPGNCCCFVGLNTNDVHREGKTEIGKPTCSSLDKRAASQRAKYLSIGCGNPETDKSYCVNQHANMRMLVQGHNPALDQTINIQVDKWGVYMRNYKRSFGVESG